jgi:hypothetical protein
METPSNSQSGLSRVPPKRIAASVRRSELII